MGKERKASFFSRPLLVRMNSTKRRSPSPSPAFSVAEFSSLVSAALDINSDRFDPDQILSFSFLPGADASSDSRTCAVAVMPHLHPCFPTPFSNRASMSMSTIDLQVGCTATSRSPSPRRPLALFQRIKRQASALVKAPHTLSQPDPIPTVSFAPMPLYHPAPSTTDSASSHRSSFFDDSSDDDDEDEVLSDTGRTEESDYIPYIPLIIQHERERLSQQNLSLIPICPSRSPPSPTPSGSTTSTRSPVTPLTPVFSASRHEPAERWSYSAEQETDGISLSTTTDDDPFAKARVQVVRTSISSGSVYSLPSARSQSQSPHPSSKKTRHRPAPLAPIKPPPRGPLPTVPPVESSSENDTDSPPPISRPLHIGRQTVDGNTHRRPREGHYVPTTPTGAGKEWTLRLGVPTVQVTVSDDDSTSRVREKSHERKRVTSLPTSRRSVLSQFQTTSHANLRREEGRADWTLSLPLARTVSFSTGLVRKEQQEHKEEAVRGRVTSLRPRARVTSLLAPQQAKDLTRKASSLTAMFDRQLAALSPLSRAASMAQMRSTSPFQTKSSNSFQTSTSSFQTRPSQLSPPPSNTTSRSRSLSPAPPRSPSQLIIPPSALAAKAKQSGAAPPSSFYTHTPKLASQASLASTSKTSPTSTSPPVSCWTSRRPGVFIYQPPSTASSTTSTVSTSSVASTISTTSTTSTASTSSSATIVPARASITITRAGEDLEFPMPPTYGGEVGDSNGNQSRASSPVSVEARASLTSVRGVSPTSVRGVSPTSVRGVSPTSVRGASPISTSRGTSPTGTPPYNRYSLPATGSLTPPPRSPTLGRLTPPPSFNQNSNGRLTPPSPRGTSLTPPPSRLTPPPHRVGSLTPPPHRVGSLTPPPLRGNSLTPPPRSPRRPSPSPSDSMWDDDDDDTETETETVYEDAMSMLSGVFYSARSSFDCGARSSFEYGSRSSVDV